MTLEDENKELRIALTAALTHVQSHMIDCCPPNLRYAEWGRDIFNMVDRIIGRAGMKIAMDEHGAFDYGRGIVQR